MKKSGLHTHSAWLLAPGLRVVASRVQGLQSLLLVRTRPAAYVPIPHSKAAPAEHQRPGGQGACPVRSSSGACAGVLMLPAPTARGVLRPLVGQKKEAAPQLRRLMSPLGEKPPGPTSWHVR